MRSFVGAAIVLASGELLRTTEIVVGESPRYSAMNFKVTRCPWLLTRFWRGNIRIVVHELYTPVATCLVLLQRTG